MPMTCKKDASDLMRNHMDRCKRNQNSCHVSVQIMLKGNWQAVRSLLGLSCFHSCFSTSWFEISSINIRLYTWRHSTVQVGGGGVGEQEMNTSHEWIIKIMNPALGHNNNCVGATAASMNWLELKLSKLVLYLKSNLVSTFNCRKWITIATHE